MCVCVSLFVTSSYLIITENYSFEFFSPSSAIYNNISVIFLLRTTLEISVFTFLCYPGTLMYLYIICVYISVQNKSNKKYT